MALEYAGGPHVVQNIKPKSAFSQGDLLELDSASSASYADALLAGGNIGYWVALSSSTASNTGTYEVPCLRCLPDTKLWITIAAASTVSRGYVYDISPASGDWEIATSATTAIAYVWRNEYDSDVSQRNNESNDSWVVISIVSSLFNASPAGT